MGLLLPSSHPWYREATGILSLALPVTVSLSAAMLIGVVDTIMIAPLGTQSLGAASLTSSILIVFYAALFAIGSIGGVLGAKAFGAQNASQVTALFKATLLVGMLCGAGGTVLMILSRPLLDWSAQPAEILAIITPYWVTMSLILIPYTLFYALKGLYESLDQAWIGVIFSFVAVGLNIPANWILIYGIGSWPGLGLWGSALASLLSQCAALLCVILHWRLSKQMAAYRNRSQPFLTEAREILKQGWPVALGYTGEAAAFGVAGLMIGWFGATALAANQIVTSIAMVLYMIPLGISAAVSMRVGQAVGAKHITRIKPIGFVGIGLATLWMCVITCLVILSGPAIAATLSEQAEVIALSTSLFVVVAIMQIGDGIQATSLGALRGILDTRTPVIITLVIYWIVALPSAYGLSVYGNLGAVGVWIGYGMGLFMAAGFMCLRFARKPLIIP